VRRVIIVQARTTSTRLPGKVLMDLVGRPMLAQQLRRLSHCRCADEIVVATTTNAADDPVTSLAREQGASVFRGSEDDVLGRFVGAARQAEADMVIRTTGDCPLIDPEVVDRVGEELTSHSDACDYASNVVRRTYPRGLDAEALFMDVLLRCDRLATTPSQREHVTLLPVVDRKELFLIRHVTAPRDHSALRWTVDTKEDLEFVRAVYAGMDLGARVAGHREIIDWLEGHPELDSREKPGRTWDPRNPSRPA
jgi:spore coat polysaccharide biosynthesis protein SpsF